MEGEEGWSVVLVVAESEKKKKMGCAVSPESSL